MPDFDIESGIIGAHTECNDVNGFCNLACVPGATALFWRRFGASLGLGALTSLPIIGALQPVGICHLMSQPLLVPTVTLRISCAGRATRRLCRWLHEPTKSRGDVSGRRHSRFGHGSSGNAARFLHSDMPSVPLGCHRGFLGYWYNGARI